MAAGRIAVVGAGLAGLSAGLELARAGFAVELFERSRLLGGRATSFVVAGREVDNGQHVFLACCSAFMDFVAELGMADRLHLQERFDVMVISKAGVASRLRAAGLPAPWHLMSSFIGYRHLGWRSKLQVARALANARDACSSEISFSEWLARSGQSEEALRAFWRPFLVPALNAPLHQMRAVDAGQVIARAFLGDAHAACFGYSTIPLAHIARAAADRLERVHLGAPVVALDMAPDERAVRGVVIEGGERRPFDGVVLALPPPQLQRLLGEPERFGVTRLREYEARPIVDVHLWHDRGPLGFDFAALLDSPVQWIFEKGPGYLVCSMSAAEAHVQRPTAELVELCWNEVGAAVRALSGARLLHGAATRTLEATFMARPGVMRPGPGTHHASLAIAGSWTDTGWPDTMESAVISGRAAARHMIGATAEGARVA